MTTADNTEIKRLQTWLDEHFNIDVGKLDEKETTVDTAIRLLGYYEEICKELQPEE